MLKICKLFNLLRVLKSVYMFLFLYFSVFQYFYIYFGNGGYLEFCVGNFPVKTRSLVKVDWKLFFQPLRRLHFCKCYKLLFRDWLKKCFQHSSFKSRFCNYRHCQVKSWVLYLHILYSVPYILYPYVVSMQICVLRPSDHLRAKSS